MLLLLGVRGQVSRDVKSRWLSLQNQGAAYHIRQMTRLDIVRHLSSNPRHGQGRPPTWPIKSDPRNPAPRNCRGGVEPPARLVAPSCVPKNVFAPARYLSLPRVDLATVAARPSVCARVGEVLVRGRAVHRGPSAQATCSLLTCTDHVRLVRFAGGGSITYCVGRPTPKPWK